MTSAGVNLYMTKNDTVFEMWRTDGKCTVLKEENKVESFLVSEDDLGLASKDSGWLWELGLNLSDLK